RIWQATRSGLRRRETSERRRLARGSRGRSGGFRLMSSLVVCGSLVDELIVPRRSLSLGHQRGSKQGKPPNSVVALAKGIASALDRFHGRSFPGDFHLLNS